VVRTAIVVALLVVGLLAASGLASGQPDPGAGPGVDDDPVSLQELLRRGGPIMWPLGLCSVIALAFAAERFINLRTAKVVPPDIVRSVEAALESGRTEETLAACEADGSTAARVFTAALRHRSRPAREMEHAMEEVGRREVSRLRDNILPLNVIANLAPLLGLLGTVFGMIEAFRVVAGGTGLGKPEQLATGIYRALITTAVGLTIAIPSLALYYYFSGRIVRVLRRIDEVGSRLVDRFKSEEAAA
jgi:biopolymer transport protein ExbB